MSTAHRTPSIPSPGASAHRVPHRIIIAHGDGVHTFTLRPWVIAAVTRAALVFGSSPLRHFSGYLVSMTTCSEGASDSLARRCIATGPMARTALTLRTLDVVTSRSSSISGSGSVGNENAPDRRRRTRQPSTRQDSIATLPARPSAAPAVIPIGPPVAADASVSRHRRQSGKRSEGTAPRRVTRKRPIAVAPRLRPSTEKPAPIVTLCRDQSRRRVDQLDKLARDRAYVDSVAVNAAKRAQQDRESQLRATRPAEPHACRLRRPADCWLRSTPAPNRPSAPAWT